MRASCSVTPIVYACPLVEAPFGVTAPRRGAGEGVCDEGIHDRDAKTCGYELADQRTALSLHLDLPTQPFLTEGTVDDQANLRFGCGSDDQPHRARVGSPSRYLASRDHLGEYALPSPTSPKGMGIIGLVGQGAPDAPYDAYDLGDASIESLVEYKTLNPAEALRLTESSGIRLRVSGPDLILEAEREPVATLLQIIKRNKAGIVALLRQDMDTWSADTWRWLFDERAAPPRISKAKPERKLKGLLSSGVLSNGLTDIPPSRLPDAVLGV